MRDERDAAEGPAPTDELIGAAEQQFRTVGAAENRMGIRIERVFWECLQDLAGSLGLKRSALVATIAGRAATGDLRLASALRSYVAMVQRGEIALLQSRLAPVNVSKLMQLAPVPAFALTQQRQLLSANTEFVTLVRGISGDAKSTVTPDVAALTLDRPLGQLFAELQEEGAYARCVLTIKVNDRDRRAVCKVVAVPPFPARAIVGYLQGST